MSRDLDDPEVVLRLATELAAERFGTRFVATYAIGSLAHGGFSNLVSDVDLALVVADPLVRGDARIVAEISERVRGLGGLAERLSLFWSTPELLTGAGSGGRLPALDRIDLALHGRRLRGSFDLASIRLPSTRDLIVEAVQFALEKLGSPEAIDELHDPHALVCAGARHLTKRILFPVRFVFTADCHEIGTNEAAVAWYVASGYGGHELVIRAANWRTRPFEVIEAERCVGAGIVAVYDTFLSTHIEHMTNFGEPELARDLSAWRDRLHAG
jgi:hypothetical protein